MAADIEDFTKNFFPKEGNGTSVDEESLKALLENETITFFNIEEKNEDTDTEEDHRYGFLGTWYVDEVCERNVCVDYRDLGMEQTMIFNEDNTGSLVMKDANGNETANPFTWQLTDEAFSVTDEEGKTLTFSELLDNGEMVLKGTERNTMTLKREAADPASLGEVDIQADIAFFLGDWTLNGLLADGVYLPVEGFGINGTISIGEDTAVLSLNREKPVELPYLYSDGVITMLYEDSVLTLMGRDNGMLELDPAAEEGEDFEYLFVRAEVK